MVPCLVRAATGVPCPGCGLPRASHAGIGSYGRDVVAVCADARREINRLTAGAQQTVVRRQREHWSAMQAREMAERARDTLERALRELASVVSATETQTRDRVSSAREHLAEHATQMQHYLMRAAG